MKTIGKLYHRILEIGLILFSFVPLSGIYSCSACGSHIFSPFAKANNQIIKDKIKNGETVTWLSEKPMQCDVIRVELSRDTMTFSFETTCRQPQNGLSGDFSYLTITSEFTTRWIDSNRLILNPISSADHLIFDSMSVESDTTCTQPTFKIDCPNLDTFVKIILDTDVGTIESEFTNDKEIIVNCNSQPGRLFSMIVQPFSYPDVYSNTYSLTSTYSQTVIRRDIDIAVDGDVCISLPGLTAGNIFKIALPHINAFITKHGQLRWMQYTCDFIDN